MCLIYKGLFPVSLQITYVYDLAIGLMGNNGISRDWLLLKQHLRRSQPVNLKIPNESDPSFFYQKTTSHRKQKRAGGGANFSQQTCPNLMESPIEQVFNLSAIGRD